MEKNVLNSCFKSVLEQDTNPIVICDLSHVIIYMNPSAIRAYQKRGGEKLIGRSVLDCHNEESRAWIEKIVLWFMEDKENNIVHTFFSEKNDKDVYVVALRNDDGALIGYYEKHEIRKRDDSAFYQLEKKE